MPVPSPDRMEEYARKGVELLLRTLGEAPEQRAARRLAVQHDPPVAGGRRVLIVSPRDWAAHVQYEAVLGHALRLRGAEVHFLTCGGGLEVCDRANTYEAPPMPCRSCSHYTSTSIEAHGFPVHRLRDGWEGPDDRGWPEIDLVSIPDLVAVEDQGLPLGRLVDIPLKWFLCAADLEDDPLGGVMARAFLRSARRIARGFDQVLADLQPDLVLLLNGLFLFEGVAWARCRQQGIDVVTYERAFLKETLVFSRDVPAGFYDYSADWPGEDRPLAAPEGAELDAYLEARRTGGAFDQHWRFAETEVDGGPGRLVTLFTNLTWDTAVIGREVAFDDIQDWMATTIEHFATRPQHRLIVRVHPSERALPGKQTRDSLAEFVTRRFPQLPPNVTLIAPEDMTSSYPLMEASDVGLVYTSTTGLELALRGVPVIVAGECHYRGKGFTHDVTSRDEFLAALDRGLDDPATLAHDPERARRYAHFFFFRAPVPAPGVIEPLPGLARLTVDDLDRLRPGADPAVDRICAGLLDGHSFASPG